MNRFNIYFRKDGRFEGRIYSTDQQTHVRSYHSFFGHSREDVEHKMCEFRAKNATVPSVNFSFSDLYLSWKQAMAHRIKESTAANYEMKAVKHLLPAFGSLSVADITSEHIYDFISEKQQSGLSNRYISDILVMLKSVFKFGAQQFHWQNPMYGVSMPKKHKAEVQLLTADEQQRLERYIAENHNLTTLGIALAKSTGLRIGELCALQWADIDLEKRTITVRKTIQRIQSKNGSRRTKVIITDPKSESSCRVIPIPAFMIAFLREFRGNGEDFVISGTDKPVEPRVMQYRFTKILKNGNLPSVHFHSLRHIFASTCIKLGFDVKALSEILGHSSVEITLNRYVHSSFEQKIEYMNRLKSAV